MCIFINFKKQKIIVDPPTSPSHFFFFFCFDPCFATFKKLNCNLQGCKSYDTDADVKKVDTPSLSLYQDELDDEDYLFRTNIDESDDQR